MKVYKVLDYSNVNSCDSAVGEIYSALEELNKDEVIQVILDQDWKLKELEEFISKTKFRILNIERKDGKIIVILGGKQ